MRRIVGGALAAVGGTGVEVTEDSRNLTRWIGAVLLTALLALVLKADYWWIAAAIQSESLLKVPLCTLRIRTGQWIHDVTVRKERGQ